MRALISGVGGFAGSHLADYLLSLPGVEVWGCDRSHVPPAHLAKSIRYLSGDLRDPAFVQTVMEQARPDCIYHLAGQAFVPTSHADPWGTIEVNVRPQGNFLETLVGMGSAGRLVRFLVVGSMEEYGRVEAHELPISEAQPFRPDSPYGVSKLAQDAMGQAYFLSHGLHTVRVRPFNHIGPRQSERFVAASFAAQIARIEAGLQPPVMRVGNLEARRDFTDVRDTVRAYVVALDAGDPAEAYNIGSGRSRSIGELLDGLLACTNVRIAVEPDPERMRPSDVPDNACDARRFRERTGWMPEIPFEVTLRDLLEYERTRVAVASR